MTCGIYYYWDNKKDILVYIGKSIDIEKRHLEHLRPSSYFKQCFNRILQNDINRYEFGLLLECNREDLNKNEIECIALYNPLYNFTVGGDGLSGDDSPRWGTSVIENFGGIDFIIECNKHNMSQKEVANFIGITQRALQDYIRRRQYKWIPKDNSGINNSLYGTKMKDEKKRHLSKVISKKNNTSGYYRVDKQPCKSCKNGFIYRYRYYNDERKHQVIRSTNINKLKEKVKKQGLEWIEY